MVAIGGSVRIKRCRSNLHAQPCWHGYCAHCGEGLSFYDFSEEDCLAISIAAQAKHDCKKQPEEEQLSLQ